VGFDSWHGQEIFSSINNVQTGAPPASCSVGIVSYFPGGKAAEVDHACLSSTVIPRLTKIIRSGITFVSRNVISRRFLQKIV
jgi:hypothetical protein